MPTELEALRDIHMPQTPGIWPLAPGWWVLLVLVVVICLCIPFLKKSGARYFTRRRFLQRLDFLRSAAGESESSGVPAQLSQLLRDVAVFRFGPGASAGLVGVSWLEFLSNTSANDDVDFTGDIGRRLLDAPYRPVASLADDELEALVDLAGVWIRRYA